MTVLEQLMSNCEQTASGCWDWRARRDIDGYGRVSVRQRVHLAHRVAYELLVGPIPPGLQIDHLCRNRACINPTHLEAVTARENTLRGDTVPRANHEKTCCKNGHPFDETNTYLDMRASGVRRGCRACNRAAVARYAARRKQP